MNVFSKLYCLDNLSSMYHRFTFVMHTAAILTHIRWQKMSIWYVSVYLMPVNDVFSLKWNMQPLCSLKTKPISAGNILKLKKNNLYIASFSPVTTEKNLFFDVVLRAQCYCTKFLKSMYLKFCLVWWRKLYTQINNYQNKKLQKCT